MLVPLPFGSFSQPRPSPTQPATCNEPNRGAQSTKGCAIAPINTPEFHVEFDLGMVGIEGCDMPHGMVGIEGCDMPHGMVGIEGCDMPHGMVGIEGCDMPRGMVGIEGCDMPHGMVGIEGCDIPHDVIVQVVCRDEQPTLEKIAWHTSTGIKVSQFCYTYVTYDTNTTRRNTGKDPLPACHAVMQSSAA